MNISEFLINVSINVPSHEYERMEGQFIHMLWVILVFRETGLSFWLYIYLQIWRRKKEVWMILHGMKDGFRQRIYLTLISSGGGG